MSRSSHRDGSLNREPIEIEISRGGNAKDSPDAFNCLKFVLIPLELARDLNRAGKVSRISNLSNAVVEGMQMYSLVNRDSIL